MKNLYAGIFSLFIALFPFKGLALSISDIEGQYIWKYTDFQNVSNDFVEKSVGIQISDASKGSLNINIGNYSIPATFNAEDATITIENNIWIEYDAARRMDVNFYHGKLSQENFHNILSSPAIFTFDGRNFVMPDDETIVIGNEKRGYIYTASSNTFVTTVTDSTKEWISLGTGMWYDDLFSYYHMTTAGESWEVTIEQSTSNPDLYRLLPYATGTPLAEKMGEADDKNYVYINTENPQKVFIPDFKAFDTYIISQYVDENDWSGGDLYGTLSDGIITFPKNAFTHRNPSAGGPWERMNTSGKTKIALPGSGPADYTLKAECPFCPDVNGEVLISITKGEDIATVKYSLIQGEYFAQDSNIDVVLAKGDTLQGSALRAKPKGFAMFSLLLVGLDNSGQVVASTECAFFGSDSTDFDTWEQKGKAEFVESFFAPIYNNLSVETLETNYEESVEHPGRIRLVNPYLNHSFSPTYNHHDIHYLYINAESPEAVYVEASPIGVDFGGGESAIWSWAGRYVEYGLESEAFNYGMFGTKNGNTITMPDNTLLVAEKGYENGAFISTGKGFVVTLSPDKSGIENAVVESQDFEEYYLLNGTKLSGRPTAPGIYILRTPTQTKKIILRP